MAAAPTNNNNQVEESEWVMCFMLIDWNSYQINFFLPRDDLRKLDSWLIQIESGRKPPVAKFRASVLSGTPPFQVLLYSFWWANQIFKTCFQNNFNTRLVKPWTLLSVPVKVTQHGWSAHYCPHMVWQRYQLPIMTSTYFGLVPTLGHTHSLHYDLTRE